MYTCIYLKINILIWNETWVLGGISVAGVRMIDVSGMRVNWSAERNKQCKSVLFYKLSLTVEFKWN